MPLPLPLPLRPQLDATTHHMKCYHTIPWQAAPYQRLDLHVRPFLKSFLLWHKFYFQGQSLYWENFWYWSNRKVWPFKHLKYADECMGNPSAIGSWYQHIDYWYWSARKVWPFNHSKCRIYFLWKIEYSGGIELLTTDIDQVGRCDISTASLSPAAKTPPI